MFLMVILPVEAYGNRDFPMPSGMVTDFTGTVANSDLDNILTALQRSEDANSMSGHVIIALSTSEWNLDEYARDYADYLQGRGYLDSDGWLIYISVEDHKYTIAVQDGAVKSFSPQFLNEFMLIMDNKLAQNDLTGAILDGIGAIESLPAPHAEEKRMKNSPDILIFAGIALMVLVLMFKMRRDKPATRRS
jgi:uncharacterized membrane protein YgcG